MPGQTPRQNNRSRSRDQQAPDDLSDVRAAPAKGSPKSFIGANGEVRWRLTEQAKRQLEDEARLPTHPTQESTSGQRTETVARPRRPPGRLFDRQGQRSQAAGIAWNCRADVVIVTERLKQCTVNPDNVAGDVDGLIRTAATWG